MELKNDIFIRFILIQFLFNEINSSPQCILKLACKNYCDNLTIINGKDNNSEQTFELNIISNDEISYKQYENTFSCQPGDKITLKSYKAEDSTLNGIVCRLEISKKENNDLIVYTTYIESEPNIFTCEDCSLQDTKLKINGDSSEEKIFGKQSEEITYTINIPYTYQIKQNILSYSFKNSKIFTFKDNFEPDLVGAETEGRIRIKIIELPDSSSANLIKSNNEEINSSNNVVELEETITFVPEDEDHYGLFLIKYKVIAMEVESTVENTIKFNVCYKYCNECEEYSSSGDPNDYKCLSCIQNDLIKSYFVENDSIYTKNCYTKDEIEPNYYLYNSPSGDTYKKCDNNCLTCIKESTNCLSCDNSHNFYFFEEYGNICINKESVDLNLYFLPENSDTYLKCDISCNGCSGHKKNCINCASNYFKIEGHNNYCYLPEEIYYNFEEKYFLDETDSLYKQCDPNCLICSSQSNNCLKCINDYYFTFNEEVNPVPNICSSKDSILSNYFLPKGGDTYFPCNENCLKCEFNSTFCISCAENENKYLIIDKNICASENDDEVIGYYLDNNEQIFKKCDHSCKKCSDINNCLECEQPYYLVEGVNKCITQEEKNNEYPGYYLNNNIFKQCGESCKTCEDGDNGNKCIKCKDHYLFYENGGQTCVPSSEREINSKNYYFNQYLNELRECHKSCISCRDGNVNNNCYRCKEDDYVFIDDENSGKCVNKSIFSTILTNYYEYKILHDDLTIDFSVYKKCHEQCSVCDSYYTNPVKCIKCAQDKGYYKHVYTTPEVLNECFPNSIVDHKYFNGDNYNLCKKECLYNDYDNERKGSCLKCHNKLGYYSLYRAPETCENIIPIDHYISTDNIIKKCAYECSECNEGPTQTSTNCDVCKEEYPPSPTNPKNCIFKCPFYYYEYFGNKYCTGENECPVLAPYLIKEESKCTSKCQNVIYYGICYDSCPDKTYKYNNDNICRDKDNICTLSQFDNITEHLIDLMNDYTPIKKRVKKYIKYFDYTNNHVDVYKHYLDEYTMYIYQNFKCINELLPEEISIDFSSCGNYINDIIIVLFSISRQNEYNKVYYQLYEKSNIDTNQEPALINNFYCLDVHMEIPSENANFNITKYKELYNIGVDLSNLGDNFFYDICFQYYEGNKDVVIKQRRKEYYQDPNKICKDDCTFTNPDFSYNRAVCVCNSRNNFFNDLNINDLNSNNNNNKDNEIIGESYYNYNTNIFEPFICFLNIFVDLQILKNMGSYIIGFIFLIEIVSIIIYVHNAINSINSYVIDLIKDNPPKRLYIKEDNDLDIDDKIKNESKESNKENKNNEALNQKKRKDKINNNNNLNKNMKKNIYKDNNNVLISRTNNFRKKNQEKELYNQIYNKKNINNNDKDNNFQAYSSTNPLKNLTSNNGTTNNNYDSYTHLFSDYELNSMELYDAILKDKRTFCYFFKLQMKLKQEIYITFCVNEPLHPFSIKIISYFFNLSLSLIINALLYNENQIYEGVQKMSKNVKNLFLRAFYAFLIVECVSFLFNCLIKNSNFLKSLVYRVKREKKLRIEAYQSIKHIKINYGVYIFIVIIFEIVFWVYISSYCYCYHGEQLELFLGFLLTQIFIEIFCIPFAFYLTCLRFIGLKCKATTCYKMFDSIYST